MTFPGFPSRAKATAIPNVFFSDVVPMMADEPFSLIVTLFAIKAALGKRGFPRYISADELASDMPLVTSMAEMSASVCGGRMVLDNARSEIQLSLERAVELGVFKSVLVANPEGKDVGRRNKRGTFLYFLNTPADIRGMMAVESGRVDLGHAIHPENVSPQRSSIFTLYESLVGTLSPLIADELAEAERLYPAEWLEAAFREAAAQNARSWRYVSRILERWAIEGPDHATTERSPAEDRYFRGKYGKILKQRLQP